MKHPELFQQLLVATGCRVKTIRACCLKKTKETKAIAEAVKDLFSDWMQLDSRNRFAYMSKSEIQYFPREFKGDLIRHLHNCVRELCRPKSSSSTFRAKVKVLEGVSFPDLVQNQDQKGNSFIEGLP